MNYHSEKVFEVLFIVGVLFKLKIAHRTNGILSRSRNRKRSSQYRLVAFHTRASISAAIELHYCENSF